MRQARRSTAPWTSTAARALAALGLAFAALSLTTAPADAAVFCNESVQGYLNLPLPAVVGTTNQPASIELNASAAPSCDRQVTITDLSILVSCGGVPTGFTIAGCPIFQAGIFDVHPSATSIEGPCGTASGFTFAPTTNPGVYRVSWTGLLAVDADIDGCFINFAVDVLSYPPVDASSSIVGINTAGMAQPTWLRHGVSTSQAGANAAVFPPTLRTTATPSMAVLGDSITDVATLAHTVGGPAGAPGAGGTITFRLYGPTDARCTAPPVFTDVQNVAGEGSYQSAPFVPTDAGVYRWVASYSGTRTDFPTAGACGDAGESVTVSAVAEPVGDPNPPPAPAPVVLVPHEEPAPVLPVVSSAPAPVVTLSPSPANTPPPPVTTPAASCVATSVALSADHNRVTSGNSPTLAGTVGDSAGKPCASTAVTIFARQYGDSTWAPLATVTSDDKGAFTLVVRPTRQTSYGANTPGDAVRSGIVSIRVHTRVTVLSPDPALLVGSRRTAGDPATFVGLLSPAYAAVPVGLGAFVNGTFVVLQRTVTDASGRFTLSRTLPLGAMTAVLFTSAHGGNDNGSTSFSLTVV